MTIIPTMLALTSVIDFNPLNFSVFTALKQQDNNQPISLYINSPGGNIDAAKMIAEEMVRLNVTCYVENAASAALQIIMPACSRVYANPASRFMFHSAHTMGMMMLSEMTAAELVAHLKTHNDLMAENLTTRYNRKDAIGCNKEMKVKLSRYSQKCVVMHMLNETEVGPLELNFLWGRNIVTVLPYIIFPRRVKQNLPGE